MYTFTFGYSTTLDEIVIKKDEVLLHDICRRVKDNILHISDNKEDLFTLSYDQKSRRVTKNSGHINKEALAKFSSAKYSKDFSSIHIIYNNKIVTINRNTGVSTTSMRIGKPSTTTYKSDAFPFNSVAIRMIYVMTHLSTTTKFLDNMIVISIDDKDGDVIINSVLKEVNEVAIFL